ncbi:TonB-dependent receptor domain-containing protein [Pedobacter sp. PWIIR3]
MNSPFYKTTALSCLLLFSIIYQSSAQAISGRIIETGGSGIENATITVLNAADSTAVKYEVSNKDGYFELSNLKSGVFTVKVSSMGYNSQLLNNITFNGSSVKLNDIILSKQSTALKEVTIASKGPVLERKVDRWIFNLNNSIVANGSSLFEAMQVAPFLKVSDNGVSMVGKGGMGVMINEKIVYLSGAELTNYLKTLRSENVEKIEIITNPPSKYEAQGNGGLINIVLKKNESLGWRGSLSATYRQGVYDSYNNNLALFFRSKKINGSFTFGQSRFHNIMNNALNMVGNSSQILSDEERISITPGLQAGLSIDYELNKHNNIGFIYNISQSKERDDFVNRYSYGKSNAVDSVLNTNGEIFRPIFSQTINLYHDLKIDSAGKKLSSSVNFFTNRPEVSNNFVSASESTYAAVRNNNASKYNIFSIQSDLTLPYKWAKIETGVKFANFDNTAAVQYFNFLNQDYLLDKTRSNEYNYTEKILASYFSLSSELSKKLTFKAGLRYEYTMTDGYSPTLDQRNKRDYGSLFPTAYIVYKANANHTLSANYSRRINRPGLSSLNPFAYYTNIYTYFTGNPLLLPSYSNNFELNYLYKSLISFTVFKQRASDVNSALTTIQGPLVVSSGGNFITRDNVGTYLSINRTFFNWWENSSSASFYYSSSKSKIAAISAQNGTSTSFSVNNNFKVTRLLNFYLNYSQNLPSTSGNTYTYTQRDFRVGARLKLLRDKLIINPSYFLGSVNKYEARFNEFVQTERTDYHYQTFGLGVTYLFGRSKVSGNNKNISFDEKGRAQR